MSLALREMRVDQVGIRIMINTLTIALCNEHDYHDNHCHQDQPFTVKNPKLDSNSALAKKRRAKTAGGAAAPPTIQEQITQESMEVRQGRLKVFR